MNSSRKTLTSEEKFINLLMKDGKKSISRRILNDALHIITDQKKKNAKEVFEKALQNVSPLLEIRARRIGGSNYQIPIEVNPARRQALAMRWIIDAARGRKGAEMSRRLAEELLAASESTGSAFKKKEDTHRMAEANKAFAHFAHLA